MRPVPLAACLIVTSCFREAPPCDQAGFDRVADSCVRDGLNTAECAHRLNQHEAFCAERIAAE